MARTNFKMIAGSPFSESNATVRVNSEWLAMVVLISDGTNPATLTVRQGNQAGSTTGTIMWQRTTVGLVSEAFPMKVNEGYIYYSLTGTGSAAQIYEPEHSNTP